MSRAAFLDNREYTDSGMYFHFSLQSDKKKDILAFRPQKSHVLIQCT